MESRLAIVCQVILFFKEGEVEGLIVMLAVW